jgi:hypothetical protein
LQLDCLLLLTALRQAIGLGLLVGLCQDGGGCLLDDLRASQLGRGLGVIRVHDPAA